MFINNAYSTATKVINVIQNPALPVGTLIEEIPCDIGRSYQGYKRGGIIEGAEKLRKEVMAAAIWLFGMPVFKYLGDKFCEGVLKLPMNIDYSNNMEGNDAILNSIKYLRDGIENASTPIVDELSSVSKKIIKNLQSMSVEEAVKKVTTAKKVTSISALVLNCVAMGFILPKFNQMLTRKKLEKMNKNMSVLKPDSFEEFRNKVKSSSENKSSKISFTGFFDSLAADFRNFGAAGAIAYNVENNNVFRLLSTDVPMTSGRVITSRTKYEGFENLFMDFASAYFYNFCASNVQSFLRKKFDVPNVNPANIEDILKRNEDVIDAAIKAVSSVSNDAKEKLRYLFENDKDFVDGLYRSATYGKYGKINRFVKNSDIASIDESIIQFLKQAGEKCYTNGVFDKAKFNNLSKKITSLNSKFLAGGLGLAIFGLAFFVPKLTFWITKMMTGRNEFTGLADYSDLEKKKSNVNKN